MSYSNPTRVVVCSKNTSGPMMLYNTVLTPKRVCDTVEGDVLIILEGNYPDVKLRLLKEGNLFLGIYHGNWLNITTSEAGNVTNNLAVKDYFFIHDTAILKLAYKNTYGKELEFATEIINHLTIDNCPPPLPIVKEKPMINYDQIKVQNEYFDYNIDKVVTHITTSNAMVVNITIDATAKKLIKIWLQNYLSECGYEHILNIRKAADSLDKTDTGYDYVRNIITALTDKMRYCGNNKGFIRGGSYTHIPSISYSIEGNIFKGIMDINSKGTVKYSEPTFKAMSFIVNALKSSLLGDFIEYINIKE